MANRTSQGRTVALERERQVWEFRKQGASFPQIQMTLGMSLGGVYKAYRRAYDWLNTIIQIDAEEERRICLEQIDSIISAHFPLAVGNKDENILPNRRSAEVVLKPNDNVRSYSGFTPLRNKT